MRKICLINQNNNSKLSWNIFAKLARDGKKVLIIDLRLNKLEKVTTKHNSFNAINEIDDFRKFIISLEPNLDVIKGHEHLNFQEFNLFYDIFKLDFFEKKLKHLDYDYIILETPAELNLLTTNAIFYSNEIMTILDMDEQGHDFANKLARFVYHFNRIYARQLLISKIIPNFNKDIDNKLYTYLVSEFTSKIISYPVINIKNHEFSVALERISSSLINDEKYFDTRFRSKDKQKLIKEYLEVITEHSRNETPLTRF